MALYDLEFIKEMTGIEDDTTATFYTNAVISKIERSVGYSLNISEQEDIFNGNGTSYVWLNRKPVTEVSEVKIYDEVISPSDYEFRSLKLCPHIVFKNICVCGETEVKITNTAGYTDYDGVTPLEDDILFFIVGMIKCFESKIESGGIESYKIDTINYKFISWLQTSTEFMNGIDNLFGISI